MLGDSLATKLAQKPHFCHTTLERYLHRAGEYSRKCRIGKQTLLRVLTESCSMSKFCVCVARLVTTVPFGGNRAAGSFFLAFDAATLVGTWFLGREPSTVLG
jgi:hypothetical protein